MADIVVVVPGSQVHTYMDLDEDRLYILVTGSFKWAPDGDDCFDGNLPSGVLGDPKDPKKKPPLVYGPFTASDTGKIGFDDVAPAIDSRRRKKGVNTPHSIIVT